MTSVAQRMLLDFNNRVNQLKNKTRVINDVDGIYDFLLPLSYYQQWTIADITSSEFCEQIKLVQRAVSKHMKKLDKLHKLDKDCLSGEDIDQYAVALHNFNTIVKQIKAIVRGATPVHRRRRPLL